MTIITYNRNDENMKRELLSLYDSFGFKRKNHILRYALGLMNQSNSRSSTDTIAEATYAFLHKTELFKLTWHLK